MHGATLSLAGLSGADLVGLVAMGLVGLVVVLAMSFVLVRVVRGGPALLSRRSRQERIAELAAWVRAQGGRCTLFDNNVAQQFTGTPFVHDRLSTATIRGWIHVRGRLVEIMEYQFVGARAYLDPAHGKTLHSLQVVVIHGAAPDLPAGAHRHLATEPELRTVGLRLERDALIGWRGGTVLPDSVRWQTGLMLDYLDGWARTG